ncbi:MAG: pilin [bacterium]
MNSRILIASIIIFLYAAPALALDPLLPKCAETGDCRSLDDVLQLFANVAQYLLAFTGSLVLLMFIWGGAEWVFSAGHTDRVKSGKDKMISAVIGMVIVFSALAVVRTVQLKLGVGTEYGIDYVMKCHVDTECGLGQQCTVATGVCEDADLEGIGECPNDTDRECTAGGNNYLACFKKKCVFRCDLFRHGTCAPDGKCSTDPDTKNLCPTPESVAPAPVTQPARPVGAPCQSNTQCASGNCRSGICFNAQPGNALGAACATPSECSSGNCVGSVCVVASDHPAGSNCIDNSDCDSGSCGGDGKCL